MTTFNRTAGVVAVAMALQLAGCATAAQSQMSSLLIRQGEPTLSYDEPAATGPAKRDAAKPPVAKPPVPPGPSAVERTASASMVEAIDRPLNQALKALKSETTAANHLAVAGEYRRLKIFDKAYEYTTEAIKLDSRSAKAFEIRAQLWREWGLPQFGLSDAHRAVYLSPRSASAHNTLGTLLQAIGQVEPARTAYRKVVELDPFAGYAWNNLCYLSTQSANYERAASECNTAIRLSPDLEAARNNMAISYASAGRLEAARDELFTGADRAAAAFNLGMLYMGSGWYQLAEESFRMALELRPKFAAAETRRRQAARLSPAR